MEYAGNFLYLCCICEVNLGREECYLSSRQKREKGRKKEHQPMDDSRLEQGGEIIVEGARAQPQECECVLAIH